MGRVRERRFRMEGSHRRIPARLVEPQLPRRRPGEPHKRNAADLRCPGRAPAHDRTDRAPVAAGGGSRTRNLQGARNRLRTVDRPGPLPRASSADGGMAGKRGSLHRRHRLAAGRLQPLQGFNIAARIAAGGARSADLRWRAPMRRASPSRPSSTSMASFQIISLAIRRLSRRARAGSRVRIRFRRSRVAASLTAYRQRLHDEIVDTFDFATFLSSTANSHGTSRRWGIEAELAWQPATALRLSANYAFLHASQPDSLDGESGQGVAPSAAQRRHRRRWLGRPLELWSVTRLCRGAARLSRSAAVRHRPRRSLLAGGRALCLFGAARESSCSPGAPTCSA